MITSCLTAGGRTTIPQPVCEALGLRAGDELAYAIEDGRVILTRRPHGTAEAEEPFTTFSEWAGEDDAKANAGL